MSENTIYTFGTPRRRLAELVMLVVDVRLARASCRADRCSGGRPMPDDAAIAAALPATQG
ncbi:MAG: hypothetical protein M5R40_16095 [Anaerolineae bacterium]|nr:hypothetical protein [Anaerolineae bacterium]